MHTDGPGVSLYFPFLAQRIEKINFVGYWFRSITPSQ